MRKVNCIARGIVCGCTAFVAVSLLARTTYVWNPNGSGGWQSSSQYVGAGGAVPTAHDVVQVPENATVTVGTDADAAFVNTLDGVELTAASSTFIFNQPSDIQWQCAIFGQGAIIKRTAATVELMDNTQTDLNEQFDHGYSAYCAWNGLFVENGTLKLPQDASATYSFGPVTMSEDATLFLMPSSRTQMESLNGYGTVTNTASTGNGAELQVGYMGFAGQTVSHFYGELMGGIKWYSTGTVYLHGTNSLFAGWTFMHWGRYSEGDAKHGHLYLTKFGRIGARSSIGANFRAAIESRIGGSFHYLGDGEDTTKAFSWTPYSGAATPIMDAGATGGVTFSGAWSHVNTTTEAMGCLRLTGSNTVPCVVTGKVSTPSDVTTYFTKEGSGTWRFANDANEQKGAMAIKEGTFQFTSIAEAGSPCALGLSTLLHEPYIGSRNDSRAVNYAFLLGGNGTFPTFEYMGGTASACSTRPLALTGTGGRLVSSGAGSELRFAGISAFDAGEKTLVLGGDSTGYNMVSNITSGSASVAVAKEGSGRWIVSGANTLSGKLEVRGGTLELWDRYAGESYTWYRLVIKNTRAGGNGYSYIPEFALYDANGMNRAASLKPHEPDGMTVTATVEYQPIAISELAAGESFFYSATGNNVYHYTSYNNEGLDKLFDGKANAWRMCATPYNGGQPNGTSGRYIYVVMRLPDDTPPILRYDINIGTKSDAISMIGVEASKDGSTWIDLTGDVSTPQSSDWLSGDEFVAGHPLRPGAGLALNVPAAPDANGAAMLDNVTSVQVATGATLAVKGVAKTISGLTVDCSTGVGTLTGIDFAANGTLNLVNVPDDVTDFTVPAGLGDVSAESLANLNAYSVTLNGNRSSRWDVEVTADCIRASKRGMSLIVR
ncbi:MAG: autotransporter-associated beta strand repeat-containing protein [Kiritimatiellae bacterium]|nr:autotransporter-associated beta strand repeat-containing protein [Kiritimatiellia bacterium]